MRPADDPRGALGTVASAALGLGLGLGVLGLGVVVSRISLAGGSVTVTATATPVPTPAPKATALPTLPPPTPSPTPAPAATPVPLQVTPYAGQGLRLAALTAPVGYTYTTPTTGTVRIEVYQLVDGQIRSDGTPGAPRYPYIFVTGADKEVKLRPGAIDTDIRLLVRDGQNVTLGDPLFTTIGGGASSWRVFYDNAVTAQVMVSAKALPSGDEIDPVALFTGR